MNKLIQREIEKLDKLIQKPKSKENYSVEWNKKKKGDFVNFLVIIPYKKEHSYPICSMVEAHKDPRENTGLTLVMVWMHHSQVSEWPWYWLLGYCELDLVFLHQPVGLLKPPFPKYSPVLHSQQLHPMMSPPCAVAPGLNIQVPSPHWKTVLSSTPVGLLLVISLWNPPLWRKGRNNFCFKLYQTNFKSLIIILALNFSYSTLSHFTFLFCHRN